MKQLLLIMAVAALAFGCSNKSTRHRQDMDPMQIAQNFRFTPNSMTIMPAGRRKNISSVRYEVIVSEGGWVRVHLPFIAGIVPPYRRTVQNFTLPSVQNHTIRQTNTGWIVTFESGMFTTNTSTFTFEYSASSGRATLDISSRLLPTVHYRGHIRPIR